MERDWKRTGKGSDREREEEGERPGKKRGMKRERKEHRKATGNRKEKQNGKVQQMKGERHETEMVGKKRENEGKGHGNGGDNE